MGYILSKNELGIICLFYIIANSDSLKSNPTAAHATVLEKTFGRQQAGRRGAAPNPRYRAGRIILAPVGRLLFSY
jgi:hypothetical protein